MDDEKAGKPEMFTAKMNETSVSFPSKDDYSSDVFIIFLNSTIKPPYIPLNLHYSSKDSVLINTRNENKLPILVTSIAVAHSVSVERLAN